MALPRTVADVLSEHVAFEAECIDRMYLNVYVPQLQHAGGLLGYVQRQLGLPVASTAPLARITDRFAAAVHRFAEQEQVPWVDFARGQRKDDVMHEHLAAFQAAGRTEGVVFIGRAQEKTPLFRTGKRRDHEGKSYPWIVKTTGVVNHFYLYCVDSDFGPFFLKFCSYFPYNAKLCLNGNHWAQRQAARAGIGVRGTGQRLRRGQRPRRAAVDLRPAGTGADRRAAAQMAGPAAAPVHPRRPASRLPLRPVHLAGGVLPDPDARTSRSRDGSSSSRSSATTSTPAAPDQVSLIFARRLIRTGPRATPGRFRTRVITSGVTPSLHVDYKHATIKQYLNYLQP